jgi:tRNA(fMet)-specific endonuclease VapC
MIRFLFDTDHLTLFHHKHPPLMQRIAAEPAGSVAICPVNIEETLRGRLAPLARPLTGIRHVQAYAHLVGAFEMLGLFPVVPFDDAGDTTFQQLRASHKRTGRRDLKIAAIALRNGLTVVTRNRGDFASIPGLAIEDWSL